MLQLQLCQIFSNKLASKDKFIEGFWKLDILVGYKKTNDKWIQHLGLIRGLRYPANKQSEARAVDASQYSW